MENSKEDTLCNNGTFSNNFWIQYEKDQIVQKTLLCTMITNIEKLEEILKSMSQPCPDYAPAAHNEPAAKTEGPTYRPKLDFVSPQMETLQKILKLNGIYGPPPKQPIHNDRLRAGIQSLCKYNFNQKDYLNQETKQNKILATFTKPTKKMERKPYEDANVNRKTNAKPALPALPALPA
jgi:hypothetical protein